MSFEGEATEPLVELGGLEGAECEHPRGIVAKTTNNQGEHGAVFIYEQGCHLAIGCDSNIPVGSLDTSSMTPLTDMNLLKRSK